MNDDYADQTSEIADENLLDEREHHIWDGNKTSSIPLVLLGFGFVVMILLFIVFLSRTSDIASKTKITNLEKRLAFLEERLGKINKIDEKLILLDTQGKKFELFVDRFDRFETSMSLKMDIINNEIFTSQKKGNKAAEIKKPIQTKISKKVAHPTVYHEVKAKETLYQISRHYGLTVDDLRKLNRLTPETVIHPGQKLIVSPVESR
ncbi:MAG: LysM peptidoglycan-binding domain-containing protein [Deltaproteobacteria bacterium]|nr:LysM peptidoglycan-binding domain-containing protein [Deltaproteobacteria bacterium]